jgi:hypothetical protein
MSDFLYAAIYDLLSTPQHPSDKHRGLQSLKDQICRLHAASSSSLTLDTGAEDRYGDEEPSLFHLLRVTKRRTQRTIHTFATPDDGILSTTPAILRHFRNHITSKYVVIPTDQVSKRWILQHITKRVPAEANEAFECEVTHGELFCAIRNGKLAKVLME